MMSTALRYTYADYRNLPENGKRFQLINGDLHMSPSPSSRHQRCSRNLGHPLVSFVAEHGVGEVLFAPLDVILSETDVVQPDLLFVSASRRERIVAEGVQGAPDLVVEILSPASREMDRTIKRKLYARHGVLEYWIVDPDAGTIVVYRLGEDPEKPVRTFRTGESLQSLLFPGLGIPLADVFR